MVTKKDILDILEYVAKNYEWKNHESDFTPFTYTTLSGREVTIKVLELTFKANVLSGNIQNQSKVGDKFYANPCPSDKKYMNDIAEVLFVDGRSALVRVTEFVKNGRSETSVTHLEHIDLF